MVNEVRQYFKCFALISTSFVVVLVVKGKWIYAPFSGRLYFVMPSELQCGCLSLMG